MRENGGCKVAESSPGIYTVTGERFPIQVINSRRLPLEENLWLGSLSDKLDAAGFGRVSMEAHRQGKTFRLGAYLHAIMRANPRALKEAIEMDDTLTLEKVLEETGLIAKWETRGEEKGLEKGLEIAAQNALAKGYPLETIRDITGLDMEAIEKLASRAWKPS